MTGCSTASLFYGVFATSSSLHFATTAYSTTRGALLAINLIANRRRAGRLEVEGQEVLATARDLPEDVWELIKREMVYAELERVELEYIEGIRCKVCKQARDCPLTSTAAEGGGPDSAAEQAIRKRAEMTRKWTRWTPPECEYCECKAYDSPPRNETEEQQKMASMLLDEYALCLPHHDFWIVDDELSDLNALSAIALPLSSSEAPPSTFPVASATPSEPSCYDNSVFIVDPAIFTAIPANANRRFARLVAVWGLKLVDRSKPTVVPPSQQAIDDAELPSNSESGKAKTKAEASTGIKPEWLLWNFCDGR